MPLDDEYVSTMLQWTTKEDVFSFHRVSLILAGHYCAGQWRIPQVGALYCPAFGWFPEDSLIVGLNYLSGIPQYISPGLGASPYYSLQPGRLFQLSGNYLCATDKPHGVRVCPRKGDTYAQTPSL